MIEFKAKNKKAFYHPNDNWTELEPGRIPRPSDFQSLIFRINGVVYTTWDKDVEAVLAWEMLKV